MNEVSLSVQGKLLPMITFKPSSENQNAENLDYATMSLAAPQQTVSGETGDDVK